MVKFETTVTGADSGIRLDVFLAQAMGLSRGAVQRVLEAALGKVNGQPAKANYRLRAGDVVEAEPLEPKQSAVEPESIPLDVVYEDSDIIVINKPRGIVVHPAPGHESGTLVNAALAHADDLSGIGGELRPGIVHRLDKDTSGLMVMAKSDSAHQSLQAQIQAKTAERVYLAVVWGKPRFEKAEVDAPIGRHPSDRKRMSIMTDSRHTARDAVTELRVIERLGPFAILEARLQTGRTHQIRVHCQFIGHPVVGDPLYGGLRKVPAENVTSTQKSRVESAIVALHGQALHAFKLTITHPRTGEPLEFETPIPDVMQNLLHALREVYYADSSSSYSNNR
jgi:23S rRNA pseudouridine1911/1915/1917 synthase